MKVECGVPSRRSLRALDLLAFFLADVRDGVGAFLAVYLQATHHCGIRPASGWRSPRRA
jgi:hypothetical protein